MNGALLQTFRLDRQRALVTGASSGPGQHVAQVPAQTRARAALAACSVARLSPLAKHTHCSGGGAMAVALHVSDMARAGARLDALASAAGARRSDASLAVGGAHRVGSL